MLATDLYLGAWLLHSGAVLKGVQVSRSNGKATAVFELEGPGLEEHAREWFEGRAVANVAAYREKVEALKDRLFDALRENENERRRDDAHRQARARSAQARR
jgi:hypothetical protein